MAVLVTGAAGFIGSHVLDRLLARGESAVGLDSFDPVYDPSLKERNLASARQHEWFTLVRGDIRSMDVLESLPPEIDLIVHLAARAGVRSSIEQPLLYESVNVQGTLTLLEWMRRRGIHRMVFASSSSVYGNSEPAPFREDSPVTRPISPYAATKLAAEQFCRIYHDLFGISTAALRLFTVYGPRQRPDLAIHKFAQLLRSGHTLPLFGDGSTARDYTYVDDTVTGIVAAVDLVRRSPPLFEVVNLGAGRTIALAEMVRVLSDLMNVVPNVFHHPHQPGDAVETHADIRKARTLLGYEPSIDFEDGVNRFLDWFGSTCGEAPPDATEP